MSFIERLEQRPLLVGDGAMGTQLMARGLEPGECGEAWNLHRASVVEQVQRAYVEAGADFLLTNTFGANPIVLALHGLEGETEAINRAAVEIARRAAGGRALAVGGLGPTGKLLEPLGELSAEDARAAFERQAAALAEAGADALIFETFESSAELAAGLEGARAACELPLIASMKFTPEPSGRYRTMMGEGPEDLVRAAEAAGAAVLGTNCGQGIRTMPPLVGVLADLTDLPVIAEPNAGMPKLAEGRTVYEEDLGVFARCVPDLFEAGARIIGGCCGTTPDHVSLLRELADAL